MKKLLVLIVLACVYGCKEDDMRSEGFTITTTASAAGFVQRNTSGADWSLSSDPPEVTLNTSKPLYSNMIYIPSNLIIGKEYNLTWDITGEGTYQAGGGNALSCTLLFLNSDFTSLNTIIMLDANGESETSVSSAKVTAPEGTKYIALYVSAATISSGNYTIKVNRCTLKNI